MFNSTVQSDHPKLLVDFRFVKHWDKLLFCAEIELNFLLYREPHQNNNKGTDIYPSWKGNKIREPFIIVEHGSNCWKIKTKKNATVQQVKSAAHFCCPTEINIGFFQTNGQKSHVTSSCVAVFCSIREWSEEFFFGRIVYTCTVCCCCGGVSFLYISVNRNWLKNR